LIGWNIDHYEKYLIKSSSYFNKAFVLYTGWSNLQSFDVLVISKGNKIHFPKCKPIERLGRKATGLSPEASG